LGRERGRGGPRSVRRKGREMGRVGGQGGKEGKREEPELEEEGTVNVKKWLMRRKECKWEKGEERGEGNGKR
jgi:hypothetical protein